MLDEQSNASSDDLIELLEELTLTTAARPQGSNVLHDERLSVDLRGTAQPADRSRRDDTASLSVHLVRVAPREFTIESTSPLAVGDHYVLSFDPDELEFGSRDAATMRCCACAELDSDAAGYRGVLRPFVDIDLRRALSGGKLVS